MYDIYIKNYMGSNGSIVTNETLMFSIPITDEYAENAVIDPVVKTEMGKTGTFEFTIRRNNPYYNCWQQMRTIARVVYDGTTIFRGRALTIDNTLLGEKKLHFEGDLAFLLDTNFPGSKEEERSEISILAYLQQLIGNHNSQMDDSSQADRNDHKFVLGEVPGQYTSATGTEMRVSPKETDKYGTSSWTSTMSALEEIQKEYGGYFRTRYVNGTCYLDWLDAWFNPEVNEQPIEIGENLINVGSNVEVDNIFTSVIPIGSAESKEIFIEGYREDVHGHNKRILVPQIVSQFPDSVLNSGYHNKNDYLNAVNKYGIISKVEKFQNADTQEKLWNYCLDWIRTNYMGGITSFDITALDMHNWDENVQKYLVGDRVLVIYPDPDSNGNGSGTDISRVMTATSITYYLNEPDKNSYTIGMPNNLIQRTYGSANSKSSKNSGISSNTGNNKKKDDEEKEEIKRKLEEEEANARLYIISEKYNSDVYQKLIQEYGDQAGVAAQKASITAWMRGATLLEDPNGDYPELQDKIPSVVVDGYSSMMKLMSSENPKLYQKLIEQNKLTSEFVNSIVLDGFVGSLTVKEKLDYGLGPVTDEALAAYIQYYGQNPKNTAVYLGNDTNYGTKTKNTAGVINVFQNLKSPFSQLSLQEKIEYLNSGKKFKSEKVVSADGFNGSINSIVSTLNSGGLTPEGLESLGISLDGSMPNVNILSDGVNSLTKLYNPDTKAEEIVEDARDGTAMYGAKAKDEWAITINKPIVYEDSNGEKHTLTNSIKTDDLLLKDLGSCKAKFLAVDQLVAAKATIEELNVNIAEVKNLIAECITAAQIEAGDIVINGSLEGHLTGGVDLNGNMITGGAGNFDELYIDEYCNVGTTAIGRFGKATVDEKTGKTSIPYYNILDNENPIGYLTFSSGTTLTGAWGNALAGTLNVYTVKASPQGKKKSVSVFADLKYDETKHTYAAYVKDTDVKDGMIRNAMAETEPQGFNDGVAEGESHFVKTEVTTTGIGYVVSKTSVPRRASTEETPKLLSEIYGKPSIDNGTYMLGTIKYKVFIQKADGTGDYKPLNKTFYLGPSSPNDKYCKATDKLYKSGGDSTYYTVSSNAKDQTLYAPTIDKTLYYKKKQT